MKTLHHYTTRIPPVFEVALDLIEQQHRRIRSDEFSALMHAITEHVALARLRSRDPFELTHYHERMLWRVRAVSGIRISDLREMSKRKLRDFVLSQLATPNSIIDRRRIARQFSTVNNRLSHDGR